LLLASLPLFQGALPRFRSLRHTDPPNSDTNFGIEVHPILSGVGMCEALELRINGEVVGVSRGRMRLTTFDFPTVEGIYNGKQIRMDIQYLGQRVFMQTGVVILVDVFVGAERACRLTVEIK
jgi:hypothetical protein